MTQDPFDKLLDTAARRLHEPPPPRVDAIWARIQATRVPRPARWRVTPWLGLAASLVLAFTLGRASVRPANRGSASNSEMQESPPVVRATTQLLGASEILLAGLDGPQDGASGDRRFARQAGDLLVTTRLLLDTRSATSDPALRSVLEDLELLLAQLARVRTEEAPAELQLIHDAAEARDIVPRIRTVAAHLAGGAD